MTMSPTRRDGATDLAGICARHGIVLTTDICPTEWVAENSGDQAGDPVGRGPTEADAVCALLKARYGMSLARFEGTNQPLYLACTDDGEETGRTELAAVAARTELAAIAALADRLTGGV